WLYPPGAKPRKSELGDWQNEGNAPAAKIPGNPGGTDSPAAPAGEGTGSSGPLYTPPMNAPAPPTPAEKKAEKAATANAAAASLKSAAKTGVPFCEECEAARKKEQQEAAEQA